MQKHSMICIISFVPISYYCLTKSVKPSTRCQSFSLDLGLMPNLVHNCWLHWLGAHLETVMDYIAWTIHNVHFMLTFAGIDSAPLGPAFFLLFPFFTIMERGKEITFSTKEITILNPKLILYSLQPTLKPQTYES